LTVTFGFGQDAACTGTADEMVRGAGAALTVSVAGNGEFHLKLRLKVAMMASMLTV
jgi:hypothetical protein